MKKITDFSPYIINKPARKNATNIVLDTLEIRIFLGGHAPKPPRNLALLTLVVSPPVSSPWQRHCLQQH